MSYPAYNFTVMDDAGNLVANASIEVRREVAGQPLVQVYADRVGASALGNPFVSATGVGRFHVETGGAFQVKATKGAFTRTLRYVGISRGAETDILGITPAGDWVSASPANSYDIGEFVQYNGRIFASLVDGNTAEPPSADASDANWMWLPTVAGADGADGADGEGVQIDASGTFAGRSAFDDEAEGFVYASTDGDPSISPAITTSVLFRKNSATSADWSDAIPLQGEQGPAGGGATDFPSLTDTPANYTSAAGKVVQVNATPDGLEFGQDLRTTATPQFAGVEVGHASDTTVGRAAAGVLKVEEKPLYSEIPQRSISASETLVLADAQKHMLHPAADNNARTFTIPANASVAYPVGTAITFVNKINTLTIAITTDTLTQAGTGSTGSRTLAANGVATALKIAATEWIISGTGLA